MLELNKIYQGDCLEVIKTFPDNSVDSIVTDPPYELGFMGKSWDKTGIANNKEMWAECLRVLKPGGHLLSFSGTRTYHRMASAIEDAGFEVRDMIEWVYGSGFPKSLNIGKAIDAKILCGNSGTRKLKEVEQLYGGKSYKLTGKNNGILGETKIYNRKQLDRQTDESKQWEGWGTALKPAHEPICMARKPLSEKTVAENVLKYGTGGINIDGSRVGTDLILAQKRGKAVNVSFQSGGFTPEHVGRFPANLIHDNSEEVKECFPYSKAGSYKGEGSKSGGIWSESTGKPAGMEYGDSGNASRFFKSIIYQAKASRSERNYGCEELEDKPAGMAMKDDKFTREHMGNTPACDREPVKNNHPTVKPIALMEYLIKMVTPKGGIVLDPFAGSGTTLIGAKLEGYNFIGIELSEEYCKIAEARIKKEADEKILKQIKEILK